MIFLMLFLLLFPWLAGATTQWTPLYPGLQYTTLSPEINNNAAKIYAFRMDLHYYSLSLRMAKDIQQTSLFVDQLSSEKKVLLAINGGFFSPNLQPIGLRISHGQLLNPVKKISWWGIFLVHNNIAEIIPPYAYHPSSHNNFGIQAGPRLVIDGAVTQSHGKNAQRSALCITRDNKVIIMVTDQLALSTKTLAQIIVRSEKEDGLACYQALNLDGGTSSQLYAHMNHFNLHVRSIRPVADVIVVTPR